MCGSLALGGAQLGGLRLGKVRCVVFSRECLDGKVRDREGSTMCTMPQAAVLNVCLDEGKN